MPQYTTPFLRPPWTAEEFLQIIGRPPERDELDIVNCKFAGTLGHRDCGVSEKTGLPVFIDSGYTSIETRRWLVWDHDKEERLNQQRKEQQ